MSSVLAILATLLALAAMPAPQEADLDERVETVLTGASGLKDAARAANELARLGPTAVPHLLARLAACAERDVKARAILLGAIAQLPRAHVVQELTALARTLQGEHERKAALELLARIGARGELGLALELGRSADPAAPPSTELRASLEATLLGICSREPGAAAALPELFTSAPASAQTSIASALGDLRSTESLGLLAGLLGRAGGAADAMVLVELASSARAASFEDDLLVFDRVRDYLGRTDPGLVVLASSACDALGDHGAVPDLIVLLEHENANVRRAAHASLGSLTGLALAPEGEVWLAWLDESLDWWDERAEACRIALVSGTPAEAAAALDETARQRLFVHDVVQMLALALQRREPDLVLSLCRALRALPARTANAALVLLRAHPEPAVHECARAALERSAPERAPHRSLPVLRRKKEWTP